MLYRPEKVLIVDDAKFMRVTIKKCLEKLNFENFYEAENVNEALQLYHEQKPDFVTMDITMPGDSGLDGLKKIKELNPAAKVLMISAVSNKSNILKAMSYGAVYFLAKPFTSESFNSLVSKILNIEIPGTSSGAQYAAKPGASRQQKPSLALVMKNDNIEIAAEENSVLGRCCKCQSEEEKIRNIERCNISNDRRNFIPCKFITVSEHQARVTFENSDFYITPLPESESATKLNDIPLAPGRKYQIMQDDILCFGNAQFTVRITK